MTGSESGEQDDEAAASRSPTPQAALLFDLLAQAATPPMHVLGVAAAREVTDVAARTLQGPKVDVAQVLDHEIGGSAGPIRLRSYHPDPRQRLPLMLYAHGGGWVAGNLDTVDGPCRRLASGTGCVVVSVDYRLSPESPFPGPLDDVDCAARWLARHGGALGAQEGAFILAGDSAGANLVAATALVARERGGPPLSALVLLYPPLAPSADSPFQSYRRNDDNPVLSTETMNWFWRQYLGAATPASPLACPLLAPSLSGLPPTLVVTADLDVLRDEGREFGRRLSKAGVPTRVMNYLGTPHGFFWMDRFLPEAVRVVDDIRRFLRADD